MKKSRGEIILNRITDADYADNIQYLAISSIPMQAANWTQVYEPDAALEVGTLFPELNLPFLGYQRSKER